MSYFTKLFLFSQFFVACAFAPVVAQEVTFTEVSRSEVTTSKPLLAGPLINRIDNQVIQGCEYGVTCSYKPKKSLDLQKLKDDTMFAMDGEYDLDAFTDPYLSENVHIQLKNGEEIKYSVSNRNDSQEDLKCDVKTEQGKFVNLYTCYEVVDYYLRKFDRFDAPSHRDKYSIKIVIYKYDTRSEKGFDFGVSRGGALLNDSPATGATSEGEEESVSPNDPPKRTLTFDRESPLKSLFTASVFDIPTDVVSFHLNLGYLGGYIKNYLSFEIPVVEAGKPFHDRLEEEDVYAKSAFSGLSETVQKRVGLFIGGEVRPIDGNSDEVTFNVNNLEYVRPTLAGSSNDVSFSLTKTNSFSGRSFQVPLKKPKMLFQSNTLDFYKKKGVGLFFLTNKTVAEHVYLFGVVQITKINKAKKAENLSVQSFDLAGLDFRRMFRTNFKIKYDPVIESVGIAPDQLTGKDPIREVSEYRVKPYFIKLDKGTVPVEYYNYKVKIQTSKDSPVQIIGREHVMTLGQLVRDGVYIGVEPKNSTLKINPLTFKVKISLVQSELLTGPDEWTNKPNEVIIDVEHYANQSSPYGFDSRVYEKSYKYVPWK